MTLFVSRMALCLVFVVMFASGGLWAADSEPPTKKQTLKEVKEAVKATKEYTMQQKEEVIKEAKAKLDNVGAKIDEIEKRLQETKGDANAALQEKLKDLRAKQTAAKNRLEELKDTTSKAWTDMKAGLDSAMLILEDSYSRAVSRFK
jgi:predicted nuclease with TOPRIM domain